MRPILVVTLAFALGCAKENTGTATGPGLTTASPSATSTEKKDPAAALDFDGNGEWYAFLQSGDAAALAARLASGMNQGATSVLSPRDAAIERLAPEQRKLVAVPLLARDGDKITLTFWYGMPPGFGPTQFVASAGPKGKASVRQTGLWQLLDPAEQAAVLLRSLESADRPARTGAAEELGKRKDARAIPGLSKMFGDNVASAREAAALALKAIGDRQAVPALAAALKKESDAQVATQLVGALAALGGADAKAALTDAAIHHPSDSVRRNAAYQAGLLP